MGVSRLPVRRSGGGGEVLSPFCSPKPNLGAPQNRAHFFFLPLFCQDPGLIASTHLCLLSLYPSLEPSPHTGQLTLGQKP